MRLSFVKPTLTSVRFLIDMLQSLAGRQRTRNESQRLNLNGQLLLLFKSHLIYSELYALQTTVSIAKRHIQLYNGQTKDSRRNEKWFHKHYKNRKKLSKKKKQQRKKEYCCCSNILNIFILISCFPLLLSLIFLLFSSLSFLVCFY